ncbi:MAG: DNA-binding protein [Aeromicrobium sp.]|nr:DNA-binding protein [Aeromicrobium sp.]
MKPTPRDEPHETRAEIARRRLAQLAASFDAELPDPDPRPEAGHAHARAKVEIPHLRALAAVAVAAAVLLVWWLLSGRPETSDPVEPLAVSHPAASQSAPAAGSTAPSPETGGTRATELVIDVIGKVRRPGIVTVPSGSRVYEAIEAAGGLRGRVDTSALNMARVLADGEQLLVGLDPVDVAGAAQAPASGPLPGGQGSAPGGEPVVNLNTATLEQLDTLPGVGPVTAEAIISWRDENGGFTSVDDLLDVKGIGDATLAELRDRVTV